MLRMLSGMGKDGAACFLDETRYRTFVLGAFAMMSDSACVVLNRR